DYAHRAGAKPAFTFGSLWKNGAVKESRARWPEVRILAAKHNRDTASSLPTDRSGSHYFAARETDANYLRVASLVPTNPAPEQEGKLDGRLGDAVEKSLVNESLFQREAAAMVNTWKDSWFAEDGVRVLYVLPRAWTDRTLPLKFDPAPRELIRVMVGRAEV